MSARIKRNKLQADLLLAWIVLVIMLLMLAGLVFICHYSSDDIRLVVGAEPPVLIRTILYFVAIATFPVTNLIRHIMLRLNQTMPGATTAKSRYFLTVLISMSFSETLGIYGFILFIIGDDFHTLYIFSTLCVLALFLYRPKVDEYWTVVDALNNHRDDLGE